jgi:hypothetical protein
MEFLSESLRKDGRTSVRGIEMMAGPAFWHSRNNGIFCLEGVAEALCNIHPTL